MTTKDLDDFKQDLIKKGNQNKYFFLDITTSDLIGLIGSCDFYADNSAFGEFAKLGVDGFGVDSIIKKNGIVFMVRIIDKVSTLSELEITPERRSGNTIRATDRAIQLLFQGKTVIIKDPRQNGEYRSSNEHLLNLVIGRLHNEHGLDKGDYIIRGERNEKDDITIRLKFTPVKKIKGSER